MSKSANPGELRTPVYFMSIERTVDGEGIPGTTEVSVFKDGSDNPVPLMCKWVNAHGSEVFRAMELQLMQPATITCRYSSLINEKLVVYKDGDSAPYEIISVDNVEEAGFWMEIKVQRKVSAR